MEAAEQGLGEVARSCDAISATITSSHSATAALLTRCDALSDELSAVRRKREVVSDFLGNYQLHPDDAQTLREGEIDEVFFEALARVRRVQRNCRSLLHTHHQRAGLALLDSMASFQELAHERLCKCAHLLRVVATF